MADPLISSSLARGAYQSSRSLRSDPAAEMPQPEADRAAFAQSLKTATADAVQTMHQADTIAQAGLRGEVDTQAVVEATIALESSVKMAVAMRDKFVQAYQDVLKMPI
ncbi:flagellar biosynthesis protein [Mesobaculum littorinae]|uniref:Flagellar hook-basal body complex protein FliE n=1 Tax=Mesobaculum littorinae TaxID=2486419 RepID=A0A438AE05_9RHOB|nr:flagellar hook-basal body complex protein FliE [Mesobaculum littorinae]RVV96888.1 flagellar biosynthesis protein [Mesobaculum littorinae]